MAAHAQPLQACQVLLGLQFVGLRRPQIGPGRFDRRTAGTHLAAGVLQVRARLVQRDPVPGRADRAQGPARSDLLVAGFRQADLQFGNRGQGGTGIQCERCADQGPARPIRRQAVTVQPPQAVPAPPPCHFQSRLPIP